MTEIRRTYKYRLYRCDKRDKHLHHRITLAGKVWNHTLALQKRYYQLTGKYITTFTVVKHLRKLRRGTMRFAYWNDFPSNDLYWVADRLDKSFKAFFQRHGKGVRPPTFKKSREYPSWTTDDGFRVIQPGRIKIGKLTYKFVCHRPLMGEIKTLTVKRDALHRLWLCFSVVEDVQPPQLPMFQRAAGFDFGLKMFLTCSDGTEYHAPLFHLQRLHVLRKAQSRKDRKVKGSHNRRRAARYVARVHARVADRRKNWHYALAHELCDRYDVMFFEDLNLEGMKRRWGRKISDLALTGFLNILEQVASKRGKAVVYIGRFERTTGKCSACGHEQKLELRDRVFECGHCGLVIGRDLNAAWNIYEAGSSAYTGRGIVNPDLAGSPV